jgi:predicted amino acid-binding ACT domain protein
MSYAISKAQVWVGDIPNQPGTLARVLEALAEAGAQLEFLIVDENISRVFVAPLKAKKQKQAATDAGLAPAAGMYSIRIEGPDRAGLGAEIARSVAVAGLNIRGASAAAIGRKAVLYLAFKAESDAQAAATAVRKLLRTKARR